MYSGPNFIINWGAVASDVFYYRVLENGNVIGRTMSKNFEVTMPTIGDSFAIQAVYLSQNISLASIKVTYNKICDFTANRHSTISTVLTK